MSLLSLAQQKRKRIPSTKPIKSDSKKCCSLTSKFLYPRKMNVFSCILESACLSVCVSVCVPVCVQNTTSVKELAGVSSHIQ